MKNLRQFALENLREHLKYTSPKEILERLNFYNQQAPTGITIAEWMNENSELKSEDQSAIPSKLK